MKDIENMFLGGLVILVFATFMIMGVQVMIKVASWFYDVLNPDKP